MWKQPGWKPPPSRDGALLREVGQLDLGSGHLPARTVPGPVRAVHRGPPRSGPCVHFAWDRKAQSLLPGEGKLDPLWPWGAGAGEPPSFPLSQPVLSPRKAAGASREGLRGTVSPGQPTP